jgi:uncharacterized membrane protein YagU involved in acid resistance
MSANVYERPDDSRLLRYGIVGGIVAGIVFALAEMFINLIFGRPFFGPLRLISTIVLGTQAAQPGYSLVTAAIVGIVVHMIMSAVYGIVFIYLLALARQLMTPAWRIVLYGAIFGFLLWVLNFLVIAPIAFPQFTQVDQLWNGFIAHTVFFGAVLGWYIAAVDENLLE